MSRAHETLQRSLLTLINENDCVDVFELTALAYDLEPDEQGGVVVSAAHLARVRRALRVLVREALTVGSRSTWVTAGDSGRPWFRIESDSIAERESFSEE